MTNDAYGNLGNEMKSMKDGRADLMAEIKDNHKRIRAESGQVRRAAEKFVAETSKANEKLAGQTRQMLASSQRDVKARARQTMAEADALVTAIRKDVAALKADAGQILADADGFLSRTGSENAKLRQRTRKDLAQAGKRVEALKMMAHTRASVAGLKLDTGQILTDAAGVMKTLCSSSRQRAAGWRDIIRTVHGHGHHTPVMVAVAPPAAKHPARAKPKGKKKAAAKKG